LLISFSFEYVLEKAPGEPAHRQVSQPPAAFVLPGGRTNREKESRHRRFEKGSNALRSAPIPPPRGTDALAGNTQDFWQNLPGAAKVKSSGFESVRLDALVVRKVQTMFTAEAGGLRSERNLVYLCIRRQGIECSENQAKR
jgi:hypothetical protein